MELAMMAVALPIVLLLPLAGLALSWGDGGLAPGDLAAWLSGDPVAAMVVGSLRAPRLAAALLVGACLGVAGAITQAVMRNPLAEPGLLGINGGAGLAVIVLIVHLTAPTGQWFPVAGFAGAALAAGHDLRAVLARRYVLDPAHPDRHRRVCPNRSGHRLHHRLRRRQQGPAGHELDGGEPLWD
jgi:ABC-type Fe3+-siderophore transport system permease subunit